MEVPTEKFEDINVGGNAERLKDPKSRRGWI